MHELRHAVLGIGGNVGPVRDRLVLAVRELAASHPGLSIASLYRTEPVGGPVQPAYLNSAVRLTTGRTPEQLLTECLALEQRLGRVRHGVPNEPRAVDIDVIWYEGACRDTPALSLPHPEAHRRRFVLVPWLELEPSAQLYGEPLAAWLERIPGQTVTRCEGREWPWIPDLTGAPMP